MKKIRFVLSALLLLCACEEQNNQEVQPNEDNLKVNLGFTVSKITDSAFEVGDMAGVFMDGVYSNIKLTYDVRWTPAEQMYWPDKATPQDFYAYAPYVAGALNPASVPFQVKADQSVLANYKASDFVWGMMKNVAPTEDLLSISTKHALANMIIKVAPGDGFTEESLAASTISVQVMNVKIAAGINLKTSSITPSGDAVTITPYNTGEYWRALIVPQTVADGTQLISVDINGVAYTLKRGFTFMSGKQSTFTVTVNKTNSGINIGLAGWETDDNDYGGEAE